MRSVITECTGRRLGEPRKKRKVTRFDWERARKCVLDDYLAQVPRFDDKQFSRVFRISPVCFEEVRLAAGRGDVFFRESWDVVKQRRGICPNVRILLGLKVFGFGISGIAFQDYFQIGESTARQCVQRLARIIAKDEDLRRKYRPDQITREQAQRITRLHEQKFGVPGMLGFLDCMHVFWKNCPVAYQGHYTGKEKKPSLVLEAFSDYHLFIWYSHFGSPGSLNDINIWDVSPLHTSFVDGTFSSDIDFEFEIAGKSFRRLWLMVDGIYPPISRFVKTLSEPTGPIDSYYAAWQESTRKAVERSFGVLQRKFMILCRRMEQWYREDICDIVYACITLHNMMVLERIERDEIESENWYEMVPVLEDHETFDPDEDVVERRDAVLNQHNRLFAAVYTGSASNLTGRAQRQRNQLLSYQYQLTQQRWSGLCNREEHVRLQQAVKEAVYSRSHQ